MSKADAKPAKPKPLKKVNGKTPPAPKEAKKGANPDKLANKGGAKK